MGSLLCCFSSFLLLLMLLLLLLLLLLLSLNASLLLSLNASLPFLIPYCDVSCADRSGVLLFATGKQSV